MAPLIATMKSDYKILEERLQRAQREAAKAPPNQQAQKRDEARQLARELVAMSIPVAPRLTADDVTPEQLATLMYEHGGRIAVLSAEGGIFDMMSGRYSNGVPNLDVFLKGHAGDVLRVDRRGRPAEFVPSPALTLALTVQPEVLRGLTRRPGFQGRGLIGRFLYARPTSLLGRRMINPPAVPPAIREIYHQHIRTLLDLPYGTDTEGNPAAHTLKLDLPAQARFQAFEEWIEPQLGEWGDLGSMTDWGGKLAGAVGRIMALLHLASCVSHSSPWSIPIDTATVEAAIQIGQYLIPHAKAAYSEMGMDEQLADARYLLRWIERQGAQTFTKREAFEGTKGTFKKVEALEPALTMLQAHNFIRQLPNLRSGPGRRSDTYDVNPLIASQNSQNSQAVQGSACGRRSTRHALPRPATLLCDDTDRPGGASARGAGDSWPQPDQHDDERVWPRARHNTPRGSPGNGWTVSD
jgi:replicative DNA helicase